VRPPRYRIKPPEAPAEPVLELYSVPDVARLFSVPESRLRYWIQTGFVRPSVRQRGRFYYTFRDLVGIKAVVELLGAGVATERIRSALESLRRALPPRLEPSSRLRVTCDGESLEVIDDEAPRATTRQLVMAFPVSSLGGQIAEKLADRAAAPPVVMEDPQVTEPHRIPSAYQCFLDGCRAEDAGDLGHAEVYYRHADEHEASFAAAHTNIGNIAYRRGDAAAARAAYERALELEPDQAEARYNLANLLEEQGETELAVAELRAVCSRHPAFADAQYNLGLLLYRLGGVQQAKRHLPNYLRLDSKSEWAARATQILAS
jgi:tetratricopeptide (TPR) repeat protein